MFNAVVALPEGGIAATNTRGPKDVGAVLEWHAATGWNAVPGSDTLRINGLEISKDGKTFYIAGWGDQTMIRLQRGQTPPKRDVLQMPFRIDNLRLMPDGALFGAGHGGTALCSCPTETWHVGKIDPKAMRVQELLKLPYKEGFVAATVAVQIGKEIWIGTNRGDRIGHVGSLADCRALAGTDGVQQDLGGRALIPGFVDPHIHPLMYGQTSS